MVKQNIIGKKTPQNKRTTYKYYAYVKGDDGKYRKQLICEIAPDGTEETEMIIKKLHAMDDAEIYNNSKNKRKMLNAKERAEKKKWEEEHPGEEWDYKYTQSIDTLEENGIELDKTSILAVSGIDGQNSEIEKLLIALEELTPKQKELIQKVFFEGIPQNEIAKQENVTPSAIRNRLQKIFKAIRKNF